MICPDCGEPLTEQPYDWTCIWHSEYARAAFEERPKPKLVVDNTEKAE